jgi:membrane protease YdiL (CAAX protease family)
MLTTFNTLLILALCFCCLLFQESWAASKKSRSLSDVLAGTGRGSFLLTKLLFASFVFLVAYVGCKRDEEVLALKLNENWKVIIPLFVTCSLVTGYLMAGKQRNNPIIQFNTFFGIAYIFMRIIHIILYEIFFRAILLFVLIDQIGLIPAVWLNIILYALLHFHCEYDELVGTIPFGLLLCVITITYHSIWPAIVIHLALALSHECRLLSYSTSPTKFLKL